MKKILYILLFSTFFLASCSEEHPPSGDVEVKTFEELKEDADYISVIYVNSIVSNDYDVYHGGYIPRTVFDISVIHSFKGDLLSEMDLSQVGGYNSDGDFVAQNGDTFNSVDAVYNLLLENSYYVVILVSEGEFGHIILFELLDNYDNTATYDNQTDTLVTLLSKYE